MSYAPFSTYNIRFVHFFSTCFEVLSWNLVYGFVIMCHRLSSSFLGFPQFLACVTNLPLLGLGIWTSRRHMIFAHSKLSDEQAQLNRCEQPYYYFRFTSFNWPYKVTRLLRFQKILVVSHGLAWYFSHHVLSKQEGHAGPGSFPWVSCNSIVTEDALRFLHYLTCWPSY